MRWAQFVPRVQYLLNFESPPEVLIIHCGGNSLGDKVKVGVFFRVLQFPPPIKLTAMI